MTQCLKALVMQSGPEFRSPEPTRMPGGHGGPPVISASGVRDRISTHHFFFCLFHLDFKFFKIIFNYVGMCAHLCVPVEEYRSHRCQRDWLWVTGCGCWDSHLGSLEEGVQALNPHIISPFPPCSCEGSKYYRIGRNSEKVGRTF